MICFSNLTFYPDSYIIPQLGDPLTHTEHQIQYTHTLLGGNTNEWKNNEPIDCKSTNGKLNDFYSVSILINCCIRARINVFCTFPSAMSKAWQAGIWNMREND